MLVVMGKGRLQSEGSGLPTEFVEKETQMGGGVVERLSTTTKARINDSVEKTGRTHSQERSGVQSCQAQRLKGTPGSWAGVFVYQAG